MKNEEAISILKDLIQGTRFDGDIRVANEIAINALKEKILEEKMEGTIGFWEFIPFAKTERDRVMDLIKKERERQDTKWGFPQQNNFAEWACILAEEFGELSQELNEAHFRTAEKEKIVTEAIHVAAVAMSIIEHYETAERIKCENMLSMTQTDKDEESKRENEKAELKKPHYAIRGCFNCKGSLYPDCDEDCKRNGGIHDLWRYATHPDPVKITIRRKK